MLEEELAGHHLSGCFNHCPIVSRQQRKTVDACALLTWHRGFFILELPRIWHTGSERDCSFIGIVQIYVALFTQDFQLTEDFPLELIDVGVFYAFDKVASTAYIGS